MPTWVLLVPQIASMVWGILRKGRTAHQDKKKAQLVAKSFSNETSEPTTVPDYTRELEIVDCRKIMPQHKTLKWESRVLSKVNFIVVHHTATPKDRSSFRAIANYAITPSEDNHLSKEGAPGIPYHYGIDEQVGVSWFNDLESITWGARGFNTRSVHISCLGDFSTKDSHVGVDEVPASYYEFYLPELIKFLKKTFPNAKVVTHRDLGKYNCPGDFLYNFVKSLEK